MAQDGELKLSYEPGLILHTLYEILDIVKPADSDLPDFTVCPEKVRYPMHRNKSSSDARLLVGYDP